MRHPRTEWQSAAQPVTGPALDWSKITGWVFHYTGAMDVPTPDDIGQSQAQIPAWLRASQNDYLKNRNPPYSLGYSEMIDGWGDEWEIRGEDIKPAATLNHNDRYAFLFYVDGPDAMNDKQLASVAQRIAHLERKHFGGRDMPIDGHRHLGATACPGNGIAAQITSGEVRRRINAIKHPLQPIPPGDDMALLIQPDDGDPAVFSVAGTLATWVHDPAALDVARLLGTVSTQVHRVPRTTLLALTLVGALPTYGAPVPTRPTLATDFAEVVG